MRYRKTFQEAVKEVWAKAAKKKEEEKPVADEKPTEKPAEKPVEGEDKDVTIKKLQDEIATLKLKIETEKANVLKPEPNKTTGEVPLRTGIAHAILDKNGKSEKVIAKKAKKEKVSVGKGQTKIEVDPDVSIGIASSGGDTGKGNLH